MRITHRLDIFHPRVVILSLVMAAVLFGITVAGTAFATSSAPAQTSGERLITVHDDGTERAFLTTATTLRDAFSGAGFVVGSEDLVEPGLDETLVASSYQVNVYRARPVIVQDGATTVRVLTPYQTARQIAEDAGISVRSEDILQLGPELRPLQYQATMHLTVIRAKKVLFTIYGKKEAVYTQAATVQDLLEDKHITLGAKDKLSLSANTAIVDGISLELWRDGRQTVTREEPITFTVRQIQDANRPVGYRQVQTPGKNGTQTVTYEVVIKNGKEVSRKKIQAVVITEPVVQVEVVGVRSNGGLTKSKGVNFFVDSKGVTHRETYYDLPMGVVMGNCGAGGYYTVRSDGVKVDRDGYILIAAYLVRYPRCSIVETSLGLGKVYDTGGFTAVHPDGFDLATDWTDNNGR